jgi:hypothetical protein
VDLWSAADQAAGELRSPVSRGRLSPHSFPAYENLIRLETRGGARVDWDAGRFAVGATERDAGTRAATFRAKTPEVWGCGCADREVVTVRQQSCSQQFVARRESCSDSVSLALWQWCAAVRRQQACPGAAAAASASGTKVPASPNNSRSLAVRRCIVSGDSGAQASIDQGRKRGKEGTTKL